MSNKTELFLDKFKRLESLAKEEYNLPDDGRVISNLERMPEFRSIKEELAYCREVRNLLQHKPKLGDSYAVEPSDQMIELLDKTAKKVAHPPRAKDIAVLKNQILFSTMDDIVRPVMVEMLKNSYTHIPILEEGRVIGVFSENTILSYLVDEQIIGIEETTRFSDLCKYLPIDKHASESFRFIPQNMPLAEVNNLFENALSKQDRIGLLLMTYTGKPTEKLLGIITAWDVAAVQ